MRPVRGPSTRHRTKTALAIAAMLAVLLVPAAGAQGPGIVPSKLQLHPDAYRVHNDTSGHVQAVELRFHLAYEYRQGALATDATDIRVGIAASPEGWAATASRTRIEVPVSPEGGHHAEEITVTVLPHGDVAEEGSRTAVFGIVKVFADAEENGNVQASSAEAQQLVPLRVDEGGGAKDADADRSQAAASTSAAGSAPAGGALLVATAALSALAGAGAGVLLARRYPDLGGGRD